jgi:hypothetical protein
MGVSQDDVSSAASKGREGREMFESYTEKARRSIFFARQQASELGLREINSDCLLLGVLQENGHIAERWLGMTPNEVRDAIVRSTLSTIEKAATNVDMALTPDAMRVLGHASEEVDRMGHRHIGTEHLFLGLLREHETFAARRLNERGITLEKVRVDLAEDAVKNAPVWEPEMVRGMRMLLVLEDGNQLATIGSGGCRIPAAGEAIKLAVGSPEGFLYRILDVQWQALNPRRADLSAAPSDPHSLWQMVAVVLIVRKEPA